MEDQITEIVTKKSLPELSEETRAIVARLRKVEVNETISYADLRHLMTKDPQNDGRHHLQSAMRILLRDDSIVFGCVPGIGYKRLDDPGKLGASRRRIKHISRTSWVGMKEIATVDPEKLTKDQQLAYATNTVQLHIARKAASSRGGRAVAQLATSGKPPELAAALDALRDATKKN